MFVDPTGELTEMEGWAYDVLNIVCTAVALMFWPVVLVSPVLCSWVSNNILKYGFLNISNPFGTKKHGKDKIVSINPYLSDHYISHNTICKLGVAAAASALGGKYFAGVAGVTGIIVAVFALYDEGNGVIVTMRNLPIPRGALLLSPATIVGIRPQ